jgi:hypothetical protein
MASNIFNLTGSGKSATPLMDCKAKNLAQAVYDSLAMSMDAKYREYRIDQLGRLLEITRSDKYRRGLIGG